MTDGEMRANLIIGGAMAEHALGRIDREEMQRRIDAIPPKDLPKQFDQLERRLVMGIPIVVQDDDERTD